MLDTVNKKQWGIGDIRYGIGMQLEVRCLGKPKLTGNAIG